jgi:CubicO group peptidase (beta-lactamase class C family)
MHPALRTFFAIVGSSFVTASVSAAGTLPGVGAAMEEAIAAKEIAGSVTLVTTKDKILHLQANGLADIATKKAMSTDAIFWIASMTKPITGVAVLMLQEKGKLHVSDPVSKYLPEFANLKSPSGQPANLTITQILTHVSGLGEAPREQADQARTLADLVSIYLSQPMQYEPGAMWRYNQAGINTAGRIVEVVSGQPFDAFLAKNLFEPLGMKDTTFYPMGKQLERIPTPYKKDDATGELVPVPQRRGFGSRDFPPLANGGLCSTATDYARFAQMLLNGGSLNGKKFLRAETLKFLNTPQTPADMPTGFFQNERWGNRGANYGWGIGTCVLKTPHEGVAEVLSPGSYGHGGAWGTQAWIDPVKGVAYIMLVARSNHPNSDGSDFRRAFQKAAADAL